MSYLVGGIIVALYVGAWMIGRWVARRIRRRLDDPRPLWFERDPYLNREYARPKGKKKGGAPCARGCDGAT